MGYREELQGILDRFAGYQMGTCDDLHEFRRVFKAVSDRLGVRPLLPDGSRASLQLCGQKPGRTWASLMYKQRMYSCGAGANTIPKIQLG